MTNIKIGIIGLGYVGLPLAVAFAKKYFVMGYDLNKTRISELNKGNDQTQEVSSADLRMVMQNDEFTGLKLTTDLDEISTMNVFIITVPTPVDDYNRPDLEPISSATRSIGSILKKGDYVIYESTVYPGLTEEEMVPILERESGLKFNVDFYCGYSPERINPGDKNHTITKIKKITSGSTPDAALKIDELYSSIIDAGTYLAKSIKVAEAAKVIENTQRDINIAFVNELAKIFDKMDIDVFDVLEAASTKWNFLNFRPGLVGGHCIGVDPYYLAQKAQRVGYYPEIILAGRRINDSMSSYVASRIINELIKRYIDFRGCRVLILGVTFKENCPDIRNSKVINLINELEKYHLEFDIFDTKAEKAVVKLEYGMELIDKPTGKYAVVILAVAHEEFHLLDLESYLLDNGFIFDIKGVLGDKKRVVRL